MTSRHIHDRPGDDPAALRSIFGANLRRLSQDYASVAGLCRELGVNRTQFNRYLSGESFPRPDVLHRICRFFGVDARILLEPVSDIPASAGDLLNHPAVAGFLDHDGIHLPEEDFPNGFYRFSRPSFTDSQLFVIGLVFVFREDGFAFIRGYEPKEAMVRQGLPTSPGTREFRGIVIRQDQGVAALIARHGGLTCTFNYLSRFSSYENNFWEGYAARTTRESPTDRRVARMVYEHIQGNTASILSTARTAGFATRDTLIPFHAKLLQPDIPFR